MKKFIIIISATVLVFLAVAAIFIFHDDSEKQTQVWPSRNSQTSDEKENETDQEELNKEGFHPDTIPAMMQKQFQGSDLKTGVILDENEYYTRYHITYKSEGLKISGIMNVPKLSGKLPVLILNHGYIDPKVYTNGQGLKREQDYLSKRGYVVIHSDYRDHAQSDFDPENEVRPRSGYVEDIMNLLNAVKKSGYDFLDTEKIGILGHSMGGGITINVMAIAPEEVDAYVLLAPINSNYKENFERWVVKEWPEVAKQVFEKYGSIEENPDFWYQISAINYLENVNAPVMLHQGTADAEIPTDWSRNLAKALEEKNKEIVYHEYQDEGHLFLKTFELMINRSADFFDEKLKIERD